MKNFVTKTILSIGLVVAAAPMQAAILNGTLNFAGDVRVNATSIDFLPLGGGTGNVINTNTQQGSFNVTVASGSGATILDLNNPPYPVGAVNIPGFLSAFTTFPGLNFTVRQILPGGLAGTPFTLSQTPVGATVTFGVTGTVTDGSASPNSTFIGQFTSNFPGQTTSQVLAAIAGSPGFVQNSFAATFIVSSVPEPGTTALLASGGLLLIAGGVFRRKQKA